MTTWDLLDWVCVREGETNEEVLGVNVAVLGKVEVLLGHEYALTEEVL